MRETGYVVRHNSSTNEKPKYWQSSSRCWVWDKFRATSFPTRKDCEAFLRDTGMVGVSWAILPPDNISNVPKETPLLSKKTIKKLESYEYKTIVFPDVDRVIFSPPYTIVLWKNQKEGEDKTTVRVMDGDTFDEGAGFAAALAKKVYGSHHQYKKFIKKANRPQEVVKKETKDETKSST